MSADTCSERFQAVPGGGGSTDSTVEELEAADIPLLQVIWGLLYIHSCEFLSSRMQRHEPTWEERSLLWFGLLGQVIFFQDQFPQQVSLSCGVVVKSVSYLQAPFLGQIWSLPPTYVLYLGQVVLLEPWFPHL